MGSNPTLSASEFETSQYPACKSAKRLRLPNGGSDQPVRTVTEYGWTLRFERAGASSRNKKEYLAPPVDEFPAACGYIGESAKPNAWRNSFAKAGQAFVTS